MPQNALSRWVVAVLLLVLLGLLLGGIRLYLGQERQLKDEAKQELNAIAQLKVEQIAAWRTERLAAAAVLMDTPYFTDTAVRWLTGSRSRADQDQLDDLREWLLSQKVHYGYDDILLLDAGKNVRLNLAGEHGPLADDLAATLSAAWHDRQAMLSDLHVSPNGTLPHLDVVVPLFAHDGPDAAPAGAVVIHSEVTEFLYPLLEFWPDAPRSAEVALVRREGDAALYLTEPRHQPGEPLTYRVPLDETDTPAVMAVLGEKGVVEGRDYRGVDVLAAVYPIPDTPWYVVATVEKSEVLAEWRARSALIVGMMIGAVALVAIGGGMILLNAEHAHVRSLLRSEKARRESEVRYHTVLLGIGDGVIVTDPAGRVELLNPVAERLTGWSQDQARGQPLEDVFRIINEETRSPVENPARRAIREGTIVGLANHTMLIARDGTEIPIADSAAPIWDADGDLIGVVLVFRDQTEERAAYRALQESEAYIRTVLDNLPIGIAVNSASPPVEFTYVNEHFLKHYRTTREALAHSDGFWEAVYEDEAFREVIKQRVLEDIASGDPERMRWDDIPITRQGAETTYISAQNIPIPSKNLMLSMVWDTTRRVRAEQALRESEARYRGVFQNNHAVMLVLDPASGAIIDANPAACAYYGWTRDELCAMRIDQLDPLPMDETLAEMERARADGRYCLNLRHRLANGEVRDVEVYSGPVEVQGQQLVYAIVHDITDRVRAEEEVRLNESRLQSLLRISQHEAGTIQELLEVVLNEAITLMDSEIGYIYRYDEESQRFTLSTWSAEVMANCMLSKVQTTCDLEKTGIWGEVVRQRKPLVINDFQAPHPLKRGHVHLFRFMSIPVFRGDQIVAVVGVANKKTDYTQTDVWQLSLLFSSVWKIVERKLAQEAEHAQRLLAEALRDTAASLISALGVDAVMNIILENVARVVPHDAANIMLIEDGYARVVYWRDIPDDVLHLLPTFRLPVDEIPNLHKMVVTHTPYLVSDTAEYPDWVDHPVSAWVRSYVAAPIRSHGRVIGFLNLDSATPGFFNARHAERLQAFADLVSIAIEHAQLYERIQRYADELEERVVERTAELKRAKEQTEAIFNSSSDVMILFHPDGTVNQVNPAFAATFGCEPDQALNQSITTLVVPEQVAAVEQAFEAVTQTWEPQRLEITVRCSTGRTFEADAALSPVVEREGHLLGVVCNLRDITLRKRMEARLRQTLEQEMELNELKSRYVSMAAHDLRNPLAVIQSAFTLLERYGHRLSPEERQAEFDVMRRTVSHMVNLLDDILVIGRAESGRLSFNPAPVDVAAFCQSLIAEAEQVADSTHRIEFCCQGTGSPAMLDPKLLRHILSNLLSNAIKYSPDGSTIVFTVHQEPEQVTFCVRDQGIGIPEADQARLFEPFHRADNVGSCPGTGLGLAIVKQSVDLHGGTITFESREGVGTAFTVSLPQTGEGGEVA